MIDLWFIDQDDQAVLIDFKTDRLSQDPHEADRLLRDRYKIQIDAYARAIQEATGRTVKERIVWLIRQSRQVFFP
jgi:ATP-dependent helicase/nuclease subunit A